MVRSSRLGLTITAALCVLLALTSCSSVQYKPGPLSNSTPCGVLNADQAGGDHTDITDFVQSANPYLAGDPLNVQIQGEMDVLPNLLGECHDNPAELLAAAYEKAQNEFLSATPTP